MDRCAVRIKDEATRSSGLDNGGWTFDRFQSDPSYSAILLGLGLEQEPKSFDERAALKIFALCAAEHKVPIFLIRTGKLGQRASAGVIKAGPRKNINLFGETHASLQPVDFGGGPSMRSCAIPTSGAQEVHGSGRLFVGRPGTWGGVALSEASVGRQFSVSARLCCALIWNFDFVAES